MLWSFCKDKTAYDAYCCLVGSEMCIRYRTCFFLFSLMCFYSALVFLVCLAGCCLPCCFWSALQFVVCLSDCCPPLFVVCHAVCCPPCCRTVPQQRAVCATAGSTIYLLLCGAVKRSTRYFCLPTAGTTWHCIAPSPPPRREWTNKHVEVPL